MAVISPENAETLALNVAESIFEQAIDGAQSQLIGTLQTLARLNVLSGLVSASLEIVRTNPETENNIDLEIRLGGVVLQTVTGAATAAAIAPAVTLSLGALTFAGSGILIAAGAGLIVGGTVIAAKNLLGEDLTAYFNDVLNNPSVTATVHPVGNGEDVEVIFPDGLDESGWQRNEEINAINHLVAQGVQQLSIGARVDFDYVDNSTEDTSYVLYDANTLNVVAQEFLEVSVSGDEDGNVPSAQYNIGSSMVAFRDGDLVYVSVNGLHGTDVGFYMRDILVGNESGNNIIGTYGATDNELILGLDGEDTIFGNAGDDHLYGGDGKDTLYGGDGADVIHGGNDSSDDYLDGGDENDTIYGIDGNNRIWGGAGNDSVLAGAGNDVVYGGDGKDTIYGLNSNDSLWGQGDNDYLYGDGGDDSISGGLGTNIIFGGDGFDWLEYEQGYNEGVHININGRNDISSDSLSGGGYYGTTSFANPSDAFHDFFSNIEGIATTQFDDTVTISADILNDPLGFNILLDLGSGNNIVRTSNGDDVFNATQFTGISSDNTITYDGAAGNDEISGSLGEDILRGGGDNDELLGDQGADSLYGDSGNDTLIGGRANDFLYGGDNSDTYLIGTADGEDTIEDGHGADRVFLDLDADTVNDIDAGVGIYETLLTGIAFGNDTGQHTDWEYVMGFDGHTAYLDWDGDPLVADSRGELRIDFDATGIIDLTINNFATGEFGITIDGAEESDAPDGAEEDETNENDTTNGNNGGDGGAGGGGNNGDGEDFYISTPGNGSATGAGQYDNGAGGGGQNISYSSNLDAAGGVYTSNSSGRTDLISGSSDGGSANGIRSSGQTGTGNYDIGVHDDPPSDTPDAFTAGEPHLLTYDLSFYDFQDAGEYTLVRSTDSDNPFVIQSRQEAWVEEDGTADQFSVNTAIATQLGDTRVGFYLRGSLEFDLTTNGLDQFELTSQLPVLWIEDEAYFMTPSSILLVEDGAILRHGDTDQYTVYNGSGDWFTITIHEDHINVGTGLSDSRDAGSVEGLLGNYDGDANNDFALDDGTPLGSSISETTLYNVFGDDWRIEQSESLFLYGDGQDTNSFNNPNFIHAQTTVEDFDPVDVAAAEAAVIAEGFDPNSDVFDAAVLDYLVMGDIEYDDIWAALEATTIVEADVSGDDIFYGTELDDILSGTNDDDYIMALDGDDVVYALAGDDTIIGGQGNDNLYGYTGIDLFVHRHGDGNDHLYSGEYNSSDYVFMFGDDDGLLQEEEIQFVVSGYDLKVINRDSGETLTLDNMYAYGGNTFATVNGIAVNGALNIVGTDNAETLYATSGNDTLEGGLGDDVLQGKAGTDVFIHHYGDGNDHLYSGEYNSSDYVFMYSDDGQQLQESEMQFVVSGYDLKIINRASGETLTLDNMYAYGGNTFATVNGIAVNGALNVVGTDSAETLYATAGNDTLEGGLGNDVLHGKAGTDLFVHHYGDGNDHLYSGEYNSSDYVFMYGDDEALLQEEEIQFVVSGYDLKIINRANDETLTLDNMYAYGGNTFATVNGIAVNGALNVVGTDSAETLYATAGNDTLEGGLGNDVLQGKAGTDLYIHREGDGNDHLYSGEYNSNDSIEMYDNDGTLLDATELSFVQSSYDLVVTNLNSSETLTLDNMYAYSGNTFATLNGIDLSTVI